MASRLAVTSTWRCTPQMHRQMWSRGFMFYKFGGSNAPVLCSSPGPSSKQMRHRSLFTCGPLGAKVKLNFASNKTLYQIPAKPSKPDGTVQNLLRDTSWLSDHRDLKMALCISGPCEHLTRRPALAPPGHNAGHTLGLGCRV